MCVIVDIVPVSTEQPLGVDQEKLFEEEEDFLVVEEGKWSSPSVKFYLSYTTVCNYGNNFLITYQAFYPQPLTQPSLNKCFWVDNASGSTWVG
jgi:hypothetical protein